MPTVTCVEDLREAAHRKVPRMFIDYLEAGSYSQETLKANRADLQAIKLKQKILVDVAKRSTATKILGKPASIPLALAPIGLCGMQRGNGEILAARAAEKAGIPFCLSTMSVCSIEDVADSVSRQRERSRAAIESVEEPRVGHASPLTILIWRCLRLGTRAEFL